MRIKVKNSHTLCGTVDVTIMSFMNESILFCYFINNTFMFEFYLGCKLIELILVDASFVLV